MQHNDHVRLLRDGIASPGGIWADLGSGTGAFTLALADLIRKEGQIYSVDKDESILREQERVMHARFPNVTTHYLHADFAHHLALPSLDGVVMANSLHFHRHKGPILGLVHSYLKPGGRLILVEYNVNQGNMWVPHPISYPTWEVLAKKNGFTQTRLLATAPSRFLGEMFSAVSEK